MNRLHFFGFNAWCIFERFLLSDWLYWCTKSCQWIFDLKAFPNAKIVFFHGIIWLKTLHLSYSNLIWPDIKIQPWRRHLFLRIVMFFFSLIWENLVIMTAVTEAWLIVVKLILLFVNIWRGLYFSMANLQILQGKVEFWLLQTPNIFQRLGLRFNTFVIDCGCYWIVEVELMRLQRWLRKRRLKMTVRRFAFK